MVDDTDRATRRLDHILDKYAERVGYAEMELLLQRRAQDMRELALETGDVETVDFEDLEGWSA